MLKLQSNEHGRVVSCSIVWLTSNASLRWMLWPWRLPAGGDCQLVLYCLQISVVVWMSDGPLREKHASAQAADAIEQMLLALNYIHSHGLWAQRVALGIIFFFFSIGCVSPCSVRFGSEENKNLSKNKLCWSLQQELPSNCSSWEHSCSTIHRFLFFKSDPNWEDPYNILTIINSILPTNGRAHPTWEAVRIDRKSLVRHRLCPIRHPYEALCIEIWSWKISCALLETGVGNCPILGILDITL